jgi:hypothetical protein
MEVKTLVKQVFDALAEALGIKNGFSGIFVWAVSIGSLCALGMIIYGGITYILSAASPSLRRNALDHIRDAVVGLIILLSSYLILNTINPAILS